MTQYRDYHYADTDRLNYQEEKRRQEEEARKQQASSSQQEIELLESLKNGEISEAEYKTLSMATDSSIVTETETGFLAPTVTIDENDITKNLSEEDIRYLALKWGTMYKPSE